MSGTMEPADGKGEMDSFAVIQRWNDLSPAHLKAAMQAFDAQLARTHELKMTQARLQDARARREHVLFMTSMVLGFVVILLLMGGAVLLGMRGQIALPAILITLTTSMATVFVLRRHDRNRCGRSPRRRPESPSPRSGCRALDGSIQRATPWNARLWKEPFPTTHRNRGPKARRRSEPARESPGPEAARAPGRRP